MCEGGSGHLATDGAADVTLLGAIPGTQELKRFLHWMFRHHHERGEWYRFDDKATRVLADFILRDCGVAGCAHGARGAHASRHR